jgi:5-dehydro-4-deoxyglucarate dehydratase
MTPQELKTKLSGVMAFPVTPFKPDLTLDTEGLGGNVAWLKTTGVSVIAPATGTGEFFSLTMDEFMEVVETVVVEVNGDLPVVVGTGHGAGIAVEFAMAAQEMGADGILILPSHLINPEQEGLALYVAQITQAVDIGVILYNRSNAAYSEETLEKLLVLENIVGFMDGSDDLDHFSMLRRHFGDHLAWLNGMPTAEMTAPAYFAAGAAGYGSAISNFVPKRTLELCSAYYAEEMQKVWDLTDRLVKPICDIRDRRRGYEVSLIKAGLELIGRAGGPVRPPLVNLDEHSREDLRRVLSFWTELAG